MPNSRMRWSIAALIGLTVVVLPVVLAIIFASDAWQAASAVATASASIVALVSGGAAIYLELDSQRTQRREHEADNLARRAVVRTLLLAELQDVLAAAMRLTDQLPGEFINHHGDVEVRSAERIRDERYDRLLDSLTHICSPITRAVAPMLAALSAQDLDALNRIALLVGSMKRTPLEIARRQGSRSGISFTVYGLIDELNTDNEKLIDEIRSLLRSWHPDVEVEALERVI